MRRSRRSIAARRHLRRRGLRASPAHAVSVKLRYRAPYDWDGMLSFLAMRAIEGVEVVRGSVYRRTVGFQGQAGTVAVRPASADQLLVEVRFPSLVTLPSILTRVRRVFDLAADPITIGEYLARDAQLAAMVAARPGLRVPGGWDGFELGVRAVLGQQITVPAAIRLAGKLVALHGEALPATAQDEGLTHLFPTPAALAAADLSMLPMPGARSRALSSLAAAVAADPSVLSPYASLDEAIARLRRLPGIGEWTAQYIALRLLREPDAFPAADIGLMRALATEGVRPTPAQLLARAESWRPWRAYAAQHLWSADAIALDAAAKEKTDARRAA